MDVDKKHWLTNGAEIVQTGDLVRLRGDDGTWSEWGSADHLAGSRVDSFVQWHGMGVQFARVPEAITAEQPSNLADAIQRWQQESAPVPEGSQWITDAAEKIQPGDLYRVRENSHSDYCKWQSADHYAGTEAGYFAAWHSRDIQFCRPARPASEPQWEMVSDRDYILRPGVDQVRCRTYLNESEHWSEWTDWHTVQKVQTVGGFADGPGGTAAAQEWQFRRRVTDARPAVEPVPKQPPATTPDRGSKYHRTIRQTLPEGYQLITDETERIQPGDMMRARDDDRSEYREWVTTEHIMGTEVGYFHDWHTQRIQFCRPVQAVPEQLPAPTTDRGERYRRTITQSLPGDTNGLSITVDIADICEAFQLPYMLAQAAKKIMLPGERGSKDRLKDLREAAWHIQRQIQIEEARQQD